MRKSSVCMAIATAILFCAGAVQAQTLVYSFESGNEGFGPNGGGTYTQDTIGATQGTGSLKATVPMGATFVGAITGNLPAAIGDPPGVDFVLFDMTIGPNDVFPGASQTWASRSGAAIKSGAAATRLSSWMKKQSPERQLEPTGICGSI